MIPTLDILLGRLVMHEHEEYVLKSDPGYLGIYDLVADLPTPSQDGDFAIVKETGTVWYWNADATPNPIWVNTYTPPESVTFTEEQYTLTTDHINNQRILLSNVPRTDQDITFTIWKSTPNVLGTDFQVTGSILNWSGTLLDGKLRVGDLVSVKYYY